ncbi:MAG: hypothetical protein M3407_02820, partial [Acidobacteriota bacterium]|nr:hypothetical protein [Acidobacteriota bacterium]
MAIVFELFLSCLFISPISLPQTSMAQALLEVFKDSAHTNYADRKFQESHAAVRRVGVSGF